jgi:hypothetical protein
MCESKGVANRFLSTGADRVNKKKSRGRFGNLGDRKILLGMSNTRNSGPQDLHG